MIAVTLADSGSIGLWAVLYGMDLTGCKTKAKCNGRSFFSSQHVNGLRYDGSDIEPLSDAGRDWHVCW